MDKVNHVHTEDEKGVLNPDCDTLPAYLHWFPAGIFRKTVNKLQKGINPFFKEENTRIHHPTADY
jgi:hypothetical protein